MRRRRSNGICWYLGRLLRGEYKIILGDFHDEVCKERDFILTLFQMPSELELLRFCGKLITNNDASRMVPHLLAQLSRVVPRDTLVTRLGIPQLVVQYVHAGPNLGETVQNLGVLDEALFLISSGVDVDGLMAKGEI